MFEMLTRLRSDTAGATAIEYGLIAALICIAIISSLSSLGLVTKGFFENLGVKVTEAAALYSTS